MGWLQHTVTDSFLFPVATAICQVLLYALHKEAEEVCQPWVSK